MVRRPLRSFEYSSKEYLQNFICHRPQRVALIRQDPVRDHLIERTIQDLGAYYRFEILPKRAAFLTFLDRRSNNVQILREARRGEFLHELYRAPQLNLKNNGKPAVGAQPLK